MSRAAPWLLLLAACAVKPVAPDDAGAGAVRVDAEVALPREEAWRRWTTAGGLGSFLAPAAEVDLRPGGAYRVLLDPDAPEGHRGNDWGLVLGVRKRRWLAVTWHCPPSLPEIRQTPTRVDLFFEERDGGGTRVWIVHTGFGDGPRWDEARRWFDAFWRAALARLGGP